MDTQLLGIRNTAQPLDRNALGTEFDDPLDVTDEADEAPQSRWRFETTADGGGTIVTQHFSHVPTGRSTVRLMAEEEPAAAEETVAARTLMLSIGMRRTLEAMRATLEG
jgi:hypothetical protein